MDKISSRWTNAGAVQAFVRGTPNAVLMEHAATWLQGMPNARLLDLGCGAARNAVALAELGYRVNGVDLSPPMIEAARQVTAQSEASSRCEFLLGPMAPLPFDDASFDVVVAHGIWNLSTSDAGLRSALREAARVARPRARLFVFTFSRQTLPAEVEPAPDQQFIFTQFAGEPQCFLTREQLIDELGVVGWTRAEDEHLVEYNAPRPGQLRTGAPVIWEGLFTRG